nr:MAG TPA: hypothetical protein [Bacteriophage sp.]
MDYSMGHPHVMFPCVEDKHQIPNFQIPNFQIVAM